MLINRKRVEMATHLVESNVVVQSASSDSVEETKGSETVDITLFGAAIKSA